ncbi:MAG: hypothetical protein ACOYVK_18485 [Bacillota bacterium]
MNCPSCKNGKLYLKDEVSYVYTYDIQDDGYIQWDEKGDYTSYLFIDREQKDFQQYVQCSHCRSRFQHIIERKHDMDMVILKKAIHSNGPISNEFFI